MKIHRHSLSGIFKTFLCLTILSCIGVLLFFPFSGAAANSPKRLANVQPGDCQACHEGGKKVLPENHMNTKGMKLKSCVTCHAKDKISIKSKMPTSHAHTLAGITCEKCHGQKTPFTKIEYEVCVACHSTEGLAKVPAKGPTLPNPHNSHYGTEVDCSLCHFQHKKSEFMCSQCHSFKNVTPSPLLPLSFASKPGEDKTAESQKKMAPVKTPTPDKQDLKAKTPAASGKAAPAGEASGPTCTTCHSKPEYRQFFSQTKHGKFGCTACHRGVTSFAKHMKKEEPVETASCTSCHRDISKAGFHANVKKFSCEQCHSGIHPKEAPGKKMVKAKIEAPAALPLTDCTSCHSASKYKEHFASTSHGALSCTVCHQGVQDLSRHMSRQEKPGLISCAVCHRDVDEKYAKSAHALKGKISCLKCHSDIHPSKAVSAKKDKAAAMLTCTGCHDQNKYMTKGHGAKVLAGNRDAASCSDCHGLHDVPVFPETNKGIADRREYYTKLCVSCHRQGGIAGKYGAFPLTVNAYGETYHGKVRQLGGFEKVAGCQDCHSGHNILPADNPASALHPQALVGTCGKCHSGFHRRFVSYVPHPDPDNPEKFLSLYLTKKFMIGLLVSVFTFFWVHSLLWWRKVYAEQSCLIRGGLNLESTLPVEEGRQYVRRFSVQDRLMHILLILSFFGVVISGFPLKYPDTSWARALVSLLGGVANAGTMHRVSAIVMWLLFLYTCWLSFRFLFPGFKVAGWVGRLFGPDSLFPRIKDLQDIWGMFKWFFNRGEKPQFDRWTYWEKFDFMAVFWGMFLIGLSGIVMWIPELSSYVMPGWMINIVSLAHSEEAFLAAVFIFTIHFFNNHLIPDKFPLEKNIFTGSYTLEALRRERPQEYERILKENRLEEIACQGPGTGIQLFAGIFGIACVLLGLALTVLIFWAVFTI
ncbi:Cytochrome b subunit of formate dehydrogenase [Syntrophus gentianae]|uniref:Cytochrome b subunit of formate dehydrogenase n=1 Tax=Syntrophus gentianae TaxID=43775 RepID=A0A1H7W2Q9_9BACT|nr:cytochrome c3 family protein [Syntrophus gentianae]SEM15355.1 Cytochrome b subunit of formate dehydrogenase [Syntrophus gentianae]